MKQTPSQRTAILKALQDGRRLTQMVATAEFGCNRLAPRILELKKLGEPIIAEMIRTPTGKRVAEYRYEAKAQLEMGI